MNIYDISREAGVSIATVSRVMNGNANVSEKTRKKILDVMARHDYTPNAFARGLGLNSMKTVGFLCADSSDQFFSRAVYYLERKLRANYYDAILSCSGMEPDNKKEYLKRLLAKKVDAVILIGSSFIEADEEGNRYITEAAKEVPVVILNGYLKAPNVYCVLNDDTGIVCEAASAYLKRGRKDLLFLYRADSYSGRHKLAGFKKAFSDFGLPLDAQRIVLINGTIAQTRDRLLSLSRSGLSFSCVIAGDDELAVGALKYAHARRLDIPSELSIIGYNNSQLGVCCDPELTTIDNQLEFCCSNAAAVLLNVLNGKTAPEKTVLSAGILQRQTTDIF